MKRKITDGIICDAKTFATEFQTLCETQNFVFYDGDFVVGDVTGITADNRLVLDVDGVGTELYSNIGKTFLLEDYGMEVKVYIIG